MIESLESCLRKRRSVRAFSHCSVPEERLKDLLWAAQGGTGPEGRRTAPSAHVLMPLELRVVVSRIEAMTTGLYRVDMASLELQLLTEGDFTGELEKAALENQPWISQAAAIVAICADFSGPKRAFADQPPRGRRGSRYVCLEAGAAMQNILLAAAGAGLGAVPIAGFNDQATAAVLQLVGELKPIIYVCVGWPDE